MVFSGYCGVLCHDITEILLKVALNTITLTLYSILIFCLKFVVYKIYLIELLLKKKGEQCPL